MGGARGREREKSKQGGRGSRRRAEVGEGGKERRGTTANEKRRRADERERCLTT